MAVPARSSSSLPCRALRSLHGLADTNQTLVREQDPPLPGEGAGIAGGSELLLQPLLGCAALSVPQDSLCQGSSGGWGSWALSRAAGAALCCTGCNSHLGSTCLLLLNESISGSARGREEGGSCSRSQLQIPRILMTQAPGTESCSSCSPSPTPGHVQV